MDAILDRIAKFADHAHGDQLRRYTGKRYIVHPWSVMRICREYVEDISLLSAALLHDVLEDTPVSDEQIFDFLKTQISEVEAKQAVDLIVELTDVYVQEKFPHLNRKQRKESEVERLSSISSRAQTIKYADLIDNCIDISVNDVNFAKVFLNESHRLLIQIPDGHPFLYQRALETIARLKND